MAILCPIWVHICLNKNPFAILQSAPISAHQQQRVVYDDETNGLNNVDDQEVPVENNVYEEINNHVSGEDVVDLQNGHADIEVQHVPQEVRYIAPSFILYIKAIMVNSPYIEC